MGHERGGVWGVVIGGIRTHTTARRGRASEREERERERRRGRGYARRSVSMRSMVSRRDAMSMTTRRSGADSGADSAAASGADSAPRAEEARARRNRSR